MYRAGGKTDEGFVSVRARARRRPKLCCDILCPSKYQCIIYESRCIDDAVVLCVYKCLYKLESGDTCQPVRANDD